MLGVSAYCEVVKVITNNRKIAPETSKNPSRAPKSKRVIITLKFIKNKTRECGRPSCNHCARPTNKAKKIARDCAMFSVKVVN